MKLFGNKGPGSAKKSLELSLFSNEEGTVYLAFGLHWVPIVTDNGRETETKRAKKTGATHALMRSHEMGFGTLNAKKLGGARVYPAAQVVARQYGGDAIHILKLDDGEYWLCVISNGAPTSNDRILFVESESEALDEVQRIIDAGIENDIKYVVYSNLEYGNFNDTHRSSLENLFLAATNDADILLPIPKGKVSIPVPIVVVAGIATLIVLGQEGYRYKQRLDAQKAAAAAMLDRNEPPEIAWARTVRNWEAGHASNSMGGLIAARESIGKVPVVWKGWKLKNTLCKAGAPLGVAFIPPQSPVPPRASTSIKATRNWACSASYERSTLGAVNEEMAAAMPPGWTAMFTPLNKMTTSWTLLEDIKILNIEDLDNTDSHMVNTASKLQKISNSFIQEMTLVFKPVVIPPPIRDDKKPYPPLLSNPNIQSAPLAIAEPMRGVDVLIQQDLPVDWNQVSLTLGGLEGLNSSALKSSPLRAEITGVIYAKNK